ncbi:MAG: TetR/AcrR family transcriptional regulator [Deltaproteobacteria bacterium]|nr:TetR/AcrR family transcriptional regulator [Deltaproteobacteria bacterium]
MNKLVYCSNMTSINKDQKLHEILKVALRLFAHYGYKKTTLEDVGNELSMTKSNLYFYITSKRDLYEKTVSSAFKEWQTAVVNAVGQVDDLAEKFSIMAIRSIEYLNEHNELRSIFIKDPAIFSLFPSEDPFYEINMGAIRLIEDILTKGIEQGRFYEMDVQHSAELLFSIYVMFLIKTYVKSEGASAIRMYEEGLKIILRGMCKS